MSEETTRTDKLLLAGASVPMWEGLAAAFHGGFVGGVVALGGAGITWLVVDEYERRRGKAIAFPRPSRQQTSGKKGFWYRAFTPKDMREEGWDRSEMPPDVEPDFDDDFDAPFLGNGQFLFSELLASGWRPSSEKIFLARLEDGNNVFVSVDQLVHIALAGSTREGKTSIIRQLLAQFCAIGCCCILLDPHYTPYDIETGEDWTPYTPYLRFDPLECKSYERIEQILRYAATTLLDHRKQLREQSRPVGKQTVLVIDEYPAIVAECPGVQPYVAKLLREGGKYKITLCVASQDFQVKTVAAQTGGGIRDSYKTCLYVGGDPATAKALLDKVVPQPIEATLGKGSVMVRCAVVKDATLAHTPWMDNPALYSMLGPSTYQPRSQPQQQDDDPAIDTDTGLLDNGDARETEPLPEVTKRDVRRKAEDIDLKMAVTLWNGGFASRAKLAKALDIAENQAGK